MGMLRWTICLATILSVTESANENVPNMEVMYDSKVNFTCMNTNFDPDSSGNFEMMWLLPNGDLVKKNTAHTRVTLSGDGKHITVEKVDNEDFGVYTCLVYMFSSTDYITVQKGVNINGPYWGDLTAKYRMNMIVGAIAAAVVLVLMLGMCYMMDRSHNVNKDEEDRVKASSLWTSNTHGIDNAAVELNDVEIHEKKVPPLNGASPPPMYTSDEGNELATKL